MAALLLDTNAMVWFLAEAPMEDAALFAIAEAQAEGNLYVSPISAWEAALAAGKANVSKRPTCGASTQRHGFGLGRGEWAPG